MNLKRNFISQNDVYRKEAIFYVAKNLNETSVGNPTGFNVPHLN